MDQVTPTQKVRSGAARAGKMKQRRKIVDWMSEPRTVELTPFQQFTVDVDWKKSPLGPMRGWPKQLRSMVLLCFADPKPAVVLWGDSNAIVYNEPYTELIGRKHPALQGQNPRVGLAEIWDFFGALLERQKETGEGVIQKDALLLIQRHGFEEETYMTYKFIPIVCDEGYVIGIHATLDETTRQVLGDRRMFVLRALGERLSKAKTICDLWNHLIQGLELAEKDAPFCLLYSVAETSEASNPLPPTVPSSSVPCSLEGSVGIPEGHSIAPSSFDIAYDQNWLTEPFNEAVEKMETILVPLGSEAKQKLRGIKCRGFGEPTHVVVCPLMDSETQSVLAFLVLALNPRRPYDKDYRDWIQMLSQQVTIPQVSAIILRQEVERRLALAKQEALDRAILSQQLSESQANFARFATRTPVGLAILTVDGTALSANDLWRSQTKLDVGSSKVNWEGVLMPGEFERLTRAWAEVVEEKKARTLHTRIDKPWKAPELNIDGEEQWTESHMMLAIYPDLDNEGNVSTIMSCITDISELKWSENQLRARMEQALEMKKQQERFIDMTSHEMRNPLSALIGCADEILFSLHDYKNSINQFIGAGKIRELLSAELPTYLIDDAIEATDTIIYCAMHQKRIIDDILTLSRLDSNLLVVSPEASQPVHIINNALKMFESELKQADTKLNFIQDRSIKELEVHWTLLDPSRVLQVLLNLMTNAIKFTRTEKVRQITVTMAASLEKPSSHNTTVEYVPKHQNSSDQTVKGGEIGVHSERGKGSTFQFYVKTRRTTQPNGRRASEEGGGKDLQMELREDALREACGFEISSLNHESLIHDCVGGSRVMGGDVKVPIRPAPVKKRSSGLQTVRLENGEGESEVQLQVLVVEDNLLNQKVLVKSLRKEGFAVIVANHGGEALEFLKETEFWVGDGDQGSPKPRQKLNLILMDLEMPVMDGITCVKQIRRWEREGMIMGHVPIIAVTANARKDQIMSTIDAGMDDVTTKPYRIQDMLKQIKRLVRRYHENGIGTSATDTRALGARTADLRTLGAIQADSNTHNGSGAGRTTGSKSRDEDKDTVSGLPSNENLSHGNSPNMKPRTRGASLPNLGSSHAGFSQEHTSAQNGIT
ncbi:hypothetical protein EYC80_007986 [Monilinia laxa]|uniref:histidine kinase n=1 Tax=Monilinia laxa TaxID=61186 RepID=A0A5N6JVF9_MONLA|nr:hypothetical protein EYC80_007986 [Monilinia laxa]